MFRFVLVALFVLIPGSAFAFSDISIDHLHYKSVDLVSHEGMVKGYDDGTFRPDAYINRAEFLKIVIESIWSEKHFSPFHSSVCFSDVPPVEWLTKYVCFAEYRGLVKGYGDDTFRPDQPITFIEAAKIMIIANRFQYAEGENWYQGFVEKASVLNAIPLDISDFNQKMTRAQVADMVARVLAHKRGTLASHLGVRAAARVTYEDLKKKQNVYKKLSADVRPEVQRFAVPTLMFHYVKPVKYSEENKLVYGLSYSPEKFEELLTYLRDNEIQTLTFYDLRSIAIGEQAMPKKAVMLTFDDGHIDHYETVFPLLEKYGMKGVFYIITEKADSDPLHANWKQLKEMSDSGHEIASHTITHRELPQLTAATLATELEESKKAIETVTGKPVISFSYPIGRYNLRVMQEVAKHYLFARTTKSGRSFLLKNRFEIPMLRVFPAMGEEEFARWFVWK